MKTLRAAPAPAAEREPARKVGTSEIVADLLQSLRHRRRDEEQAREEMTKQAAGGYADGVMARLADVLEAEARAYIYQEVAIALTATPLAPTEKDRAAMSFPARAQAVERLVLRRALDIAKGYEWGASSTCPWDRARAAARVKGKAAALDDIAGNLRHYLSHQDEFVDDVYDPPAPPDDEPNVEPAQMFDDAVTACRFGRGLSHDVEDARLRVYVYRLQGRRGNVAGRYYVRVDSRAHVGFRNGPDTSYDATLLQAYCEGRTA